MKSYVLKCEYSNQFYLIDVINSGTLYQLRLFPVSLDCGNFVPDRNTLLSQSYFSNDSIAFKHVRSLVQSELWNYLIRSYNLNTIPYVTVLRVF